MKWIVSSLPIIPSGRFRGNGKGGFLKRGLFMNFPPRLSMDAGLTITIFSGPPHRSPTASRVDTTIRAAFPIPLGEGQGEEKLGRDVSSSWLSDIPRRYSTTRLTPEAYGLVPLRECLNDNRYRYWNGNGFSPHSRFWYASHKARKYFNTITGSGLVWGSSARQ